MLTLFKPILRGRDINRYYASHEDLWLINIHNGYDNTPRIDVNQYPGIKKHLDQNYDSLEKRYYKGGTPYNLRNCAYVAEFDKEKIIYQEMVQEPSFSYSEAETIFCVDTGRIITGENLKYLLLIFNSKLFFYSVKNFYGGGGLGASGVRMKHTFFDKFPIVKEFNKDLVENFAMKMIALNDRKSKSKKRFFSRLFSSLNLVTITGKLEEFYDSDFKTFINELKKQKITLTLKQQDEWEDYFNDYKQEINALQLDIDKTDREIDQMVYEFYGLTEEEIKVVENG